MAEDELAAFRKRWKKELSSKKEEKGLVCAPSPSSDVPGQSGHRDLKIRYFEDSKQNLSEACGAVKAEGDVCPEDEVGRKGGGEAAADSEDQPGYVSIAHSLLDGRTSPLLDRIQEERSRRKRQYRNMTDACSTSLQQLPQRKVKKDEELLDQLIHDLVREPCGWKY